MKHIGYYQTLADLAWLLLFIAVIVYILDLTSYNYRGRWNRIAFLPTQSPTLLVSSGLGM